MPKMVRVLPTSDKVRRAVKHPAGQKGFDAQGGIGIWPLDGFTQRRVRDGDIVIEGDEEPAAK